MFKVVEAFSGIGSQAKALKNIGVEHEIIATIDWDINAIIAYDIIQNGTPNLDVCNELSIEEIKNELCTYTLSRDGKKPMDKSSIRRLPDITARHLYAAIKRSKNLVSITDVKGYNLPDEINLLTYSFPCQDLSIARAWHGDNGGIDRGVENRSGMLWEVERILNERIEYKKELPEFLLMENVTNILSDRHKNSFQEWKDSLEKMGYYNKVYKLNAERFGIPQKRSRTYMVSVLCKNDTERVAVEKFFMINDLNNVDLELKKELCEYLKLDYNIEIYKREADINNPNNTESRRKIRENSLHIVKDNKVVCKSISTITTKQDRYPNSGLIEYNSDNENKINYRNLTPRECFLLMGFEESDFIKLINNNFMVRKNIAFFTNSKLHKMAGNSIVVNVLEAIFEQVIYINKNILRKN